MGSLPPNIDLATLVGEHHETLYRYAYRLCGSAADAEDLTQQAFLIAHQKLDQVRDPGTARSWLFTVLKNVYFKSRRRKTAATTTSLQIDIDSIPEDLPDELDVDRELLQAALNELDEGFRLVVLFFYFEDCSYREIAERLGIAVGTVMSRLSRAKAHLRARLLEPHLVLPAPRSGQDHGGQGT